MAIDRKINTHKKQFDLKTHIRDGKGNIRESNPYRLTIVNGVKEFERPPGSGYFYTEGGDLIRSPKGTEAQRSTAKPKAEFSNDELSKQLSDIHAKVNEKTNDDIDLSEEIQIMEQSGAMEAAAEIKAAKFNKPNFVK